MWELYEIAHAAGTLLLLVLVLAVGRWLYSLGTGYNLQEQLTEADNPAVGLALTGYLGGLAIALLGLIATPGHEVEDWVGVATDLGEFGIYAVISLGLLRLSAVVNDRLILRNFENRKELIDDRNVGAGSVIAASYIATGLVLSGALGGQVVPGYLGEDPGVADRLVHGIAATLVFFAAGQVVLVVYTFIYERISRFKPLDAIERDVVLADGRRVGGNAAAGMGLGAHLVALGIILWGATSGDFEGWVTNGMHFALVAGLGVLVLPVWHFLVDHVFLGRGNLAKEIYEDHNPNAALLEGVCLIGFALALVFVLRPHPVDSVESLTAVADAGDTTEAPADAPAP